MSVLLKAINDPTITIPKIKGCLQLTEELIKRGVHPDAAATAASRVFRSNDS